MGWLVVIGFLAALLGGVGWIWHVWQTRFASKMMDYDSREIAFLAEARRTAPDAVAAPPAQVAPRPTLADLPPEAAALLMATPAEAALGSAAAPAQTAPAMRAGERPPPLLDEAARGIYADLKRGVGSYPITVCVDIARLVPDTQLIPPRVQVDYLVCRKDFTPVVAIFLDRGSSDPLRVRALQLLRQSRIRVLHWSASAPPSAEDMHQQIFRVKPQNDNATQ